MARTREATANGAASRYLRTAYPVMAWLAVCYALTLGVLNISQALGSRLGAIASGVEHRLHLATWQGPTALPVILGAFMLFLAYEMWLRKRAALFVFCGFLIAQAAADMSRGMTQRAGVVTICLAVALLVAAPRFPARPDPHSYRRFKATLPVFCAVFFGYGVLGLYLLRFQVGLRDQGVYALAYRSVAVTVGEAGVAMHGWAMAFRVSLTAVAGIGFACLLSMLFRPYRDFNQAEGERLQRARELVRRYGSDSLAYFNLRHDKSLFFLEDEAFLAYRVVGDVAVMSGDPVGPASLLPALLAEFREYCLTRGWRMGGIGANGNLAPLYENAGLKAFPLGEEAVVHLQRFSLEGRAMRKLRQSVNKMGRMGYTMEFMFNAGIPAHVRHELARISSDWRGGREETGFSMGLGRLLAVEDPDCLLSLAYDGGMNPVGFLYLVPMYPGLGYSLDIHRYKPDTPGALNEFMIASTALFLKSKGYSDLSLHFLALSQHYREDSPREASRLWAFAAGKLDRLFPVVSSYRFDRKFLPGYTPRVILHQSAADLLLVAFSVMCAESALQLKRGQT
ncbi:MAG: phosphatidylglycerol lysyltransferase domain-containing protein [Actinomycetota bacterium]